MKRLVFGAVAVAILLAAWAAMNGGSAAWAQRPAGAPLPGTGGDFIVVPTTLGEKTQVLTVIDPKRQALGVYHVDLATGKIALRAVRNLQWDLQVAYLNNENPLPQEIRALLEQR